MPRLGEVARERRDVLTLAGCKWLARAMNQAGLVRGGIYLLSGSPGAGKTTLALQIAVDLADQRHKVVYVTFEQSIDDLKVIVDDRIFQRVSSKTKRATKSYSLDEGIKELQRIQGDDESFTRRKERVEEYLYLEDTVQSPESLTDFLTKRVGFGDLQGAELIVIDSLQGQGLSGAATKTYQRIYEFTNKTKAAKIPVILTCHVTKAGQIAGPRSLEHNVDCVIYMRKAMRLRPLFVPKNRFGPERHEPEILVMNSAGVLEPSPHTHSTARMAYGYLPGADKGVEVQATVKLPKFGESAKIKAPYLPRDVIRQLVEIVGGLDDIDISEMTFDINCAIPGSRPFSRLLDFPLAISMLSSYLQRDIPSRSLFIGELDLFRNVRPVDQSDRVQSFAEMIEKGPGQPFKHIYMNPETALELKVMGADLKGASVVEVDNLADAVRYLWPEVTSD